MIASFGYVVAAPFHTDPTFRNGEDLENTTDIFHLVTHLEEFNALQALRPLALSATSTLCSGNRNGAIASIRRRSARSARAWAPSRSC